MNWNFTHDYILQWLKTKNVKNVILIGCADFENDKHYNSDERFNPCQTNIDWSINFINNIKEFKVYTMNENSKLNVPRTDLKEFLK